MAKVTATSAVRIKASPSRARATIDADPVATRTKSGTSRKLKKRGTTYVRVIQNATTVVTTPADTISAGCHRRSSGLDPMSTANAITAAGDAIDGSMNASSRSVRAGMSVWSIGAVTSHQVEIPWPYSPRLVPAMSSMCGQYHARTAPSAGAIPIPTRVRRSRLTSIATAVAANATAKCGSVREPTIPARVKPTIAPVRPVRSASSAQTTSTLIAQKASP